MPWLTAVNNLWLKQVEICQQHKKEKFDRTAQILWKYFTRDYRDLWLPAEGEGDNWMDGNEATRIRVAKSAEFVQLMLPHIHEKLSERSVSPRFPILPDFLQQLVQAMGAQLNTRDQERAVAWLMEFWLNYLPGEYDLTREVRSALPEALVKGRAVVWHEMMDGPYGKIPVSTCDSVDRLLIDADCLYYRDAGFIIRERRQQIWRTVERFGKTSGITADQLRGSYESNFSKAWYDARSYGKEERDKDVCVYYEVWSRMGFGERLQDWPDEYEDYREPLESVGPNVFLAVMPGMEHPLNLSPQSLTGAEGPSMIKAQVEWPIAYHADRLTPWPATTLDFLPDPDSAWAISPLKNALPYQIYLDRAYTWLMSRMGVTSRSIAVVSKELSGRLKDAMVSDDDLALVEIDGKAIDVREHIYMLEMPEIKSEAIAVLEMVERKFEMASGLDPRFYGGSPSKQDRSAEATMAAETHLNSRPDDFAQIVRNWEGEIAKREGQASRLYVLPETVSPLFGEPPPDFEDPATITQSPLSWLWGSLVNTDDPGQAMADLRYTTAAGPSVRKNRLKRNADAQALIQAVGPLFSQMAPMEPRPFNGLMGLLARLMEIPEFNEVRLPEMPMQQVAQQQPSPGEQ